MVLAIVTIKGTYPRTARFAGSQRAINSSIPYVLKIERSFLKNRSSHVAFNGNNVQFGVPQGAVLRPTLYNIFTADLVMFDGVRYFLFANDSGFLAEDSDPVIVVTKLQAA